MTEFGRILSDLRDAEVAFVVVGGIAVIAHGVVRATRDVDAIIAQDDRNLARVADLIERWGATRPDGSALPEGWVRAGRTLNLSTPHGEVDLLPDRARDQTFADLRQRASERRIDGVPALVVSLGDLVALKRFAGRPIDHVDLAKLREAHGELPEP